MVVEAPAFMRGGEFLHFRDDAYYFNKRSCFG
jgi:hypothetical protein